MFRFFFPLFLICFKLLFAQNTPPSSANALQLQLTNLNGIIHLGPLYGGALSLQRHLSPALALRLGIEPTYIDRHSESEVTDTLFVTRRWKDYQYYRGLGANLDALYYLNGGKPVKPYLGGGVGIFYKKQKEANSKYELQIWNLQLIAGVAWFVKPNFSVELEYGLRFEKRVFTYDYQLPPNAIKKVEQTDQQFYSKPITILISLYF
ncbi:hypothetical protein ACX8XN_03585 [Calditrichota bacterium GD2]